MVTPFANNFSLGVRQAQAPAFSVAIQDEKQFVQSRAKARLKVSRRQSWQSKVRQSETKQDEVRQSQTKPKREVRQSQTKSDKVRQSQTKSDKVRQSQTKSDKVRGNQTKSDKVRRSKAKQGNRFSSRRWLLRQTCFVHIEKWSSATFKSMWRLRAQLTKVRLSETK
jgi:hypothetical protein